MSISPKTKFSRETNLVDSDQKSLEPAAEKIPAQPYVLLAPDALFEDIIWDVSIFAS